LFLLRVLLPFAVLLVVGLGIAFAVTRDRRYLRYMLLSVQVILLVVIAFALLYVFERVLLL
jgi:hypothetical protein